MYINYGCISLKDNFFKYRISNIIYTNIHVIYCVIYSDPPENISITPRLLQVVENEMPDRIECQGWGNPPPKYKWLHNNELITTSQQLNLGPLERGRAGQYDCVATNKHGDITASTTVDVLCECYFSSFF